MKYDTPVGDTVLDDEAGPVGKPLDRVDGRLKVTGRATYAAEYAGEGTAVYGYVVQATIAKGRITAIDTSTAEQMPGVLLVLTYRNANPPGGQGARTPAGPRGPGSRGVPQLADDRIDHYGQPVALAVANTFEQARAAARAVKVAYEREPFAAEMKPRLDQAVQPPAGSHPDTSVGDFDGAFAAAPVKLDLTYTTPHESHAMMEPHATIASWQGDKLTLHTANQMINQGLGSVAATLKIPKEDIRVISRYIGGGFGGKLLVWGDCVLAALASRKLRGRPVKVALDRPQVFEVTGHRPETLQRIRLGTDADGRIQAIAHEAWSSNNPGETTFEPAAVATRSLYAGANRRTVHRLVPLDIPVGCSMRAPGEAVGLLALESAMDELAEQVGIDPIELRVRNEPAVDPETGLPYSSRQLIPAMREGARRFGWERRNPKPGQVRDGRWLVGMGMAAGTRGVMFMPTNCRLTLNPDGTATVRLAMTDPGTGTYTILTQIAAEMLGLPMDKVTVLMGDTTFPETWGSGGSWGAQSSGSAVYMACEDLRAKLIQAAGVDPAAARFHEGRLVAGDRSFSLAELAAGKPVEAFGDIEPGALFKQYSQQSYGAHFAEVGVDMDTGEIRMRRMLSVCAAGRILNEKTARSQCIGGMTMGLGSALMEVLVMDPRFGSFVNHDMAEYQVPANADVPELEVVFLPELDDKSSPIKAKGIGELGICGVGAAVNNAVYNATGVRVRDFPVTLDKVLQKT